ncbi:MAG: DUF86 domain-containing protein [Candidatus Muirbacterium halophilum]|nr:DUF86 domain-containing protein [Candidatus Muirbacterium halophilum]MCK9475222.1 DUF86 domain-containing protein [Candidatus Muirbacterium halophilum]
MKNYKTIKYLNTYDECKIHRDRFLFACDKIKGFFPLNIKNYNNISDEDVSFFDQFIYRFTKLQDSMGRKLFPYLLELIGEESKEIPFIDIVNRFEKLEILESNFWFEMRRLRNILSHEYSKIQEENISALNLIFENKEKFLLILVNIHKFSLKYL